MHIVLVWVWWAWMSACARLFLQLGFENIIWIDACVSELTTTLAEQWIHIYIGHNKYTIQPEDFVIYSSAAKDSPEVQQAVSYMQTTHKKTKAPLSYFQFLWELSKYFSTIAIAWTHGKSTTTALTWATMDKHHPDFWVCIVWAGVADRWGNNIKLNTTHHQDIKDIVHHIISAKWPRVENLIKRYFFVIEACEYMYQFLSLDVDYALITNIELDHADVYGNFENYLDTFVKFSIKVKNRIFSLAWTPGIDALQQLLPNKDIHLIEPRTFTFSHLLWAHNHLNASLALQINKHLCKKHEPIASMEWLINTIQSFTSLRRRGELVWHNNHWIPIITDYAHHPTELQSTLKAIEEKYGSHITLIFQPHQARRVVEFWNEFIKILQTTNNPTIYSIYTAREKISDLVHYNIKSQYLSKNVSNLSSFEELWTLFAQQCKGTYMIDFASIHSIITQQTTWVILICTAGNLDWEMRQWLDQQ